MAKTIDEEVAERLRSRDKLRAAAVRILAEVAGPDLLGSELESLVMRAREGGPLPGELEPHREKYAALDVAALATAIKERAKQTE